MASSVNSASAVNVNVATGSGTSTFVPATGSAHRAILALCTHEQTNGARPLPSLSANGVSFQNIGTFNAGASGSFVYNEAWICFEADIASVGSNPSLSIGTPTSGNANVAVTLVTVMDCSQTLADWQSFFAHDNDLVTAAMSAALSGFTTGSAILGCAGDGVGGFSIATNLGDTVTEFTGSDRNYPTGSRSVAYYGTAASATPSVGVDSGASGTNYQTMILIGAPDAVTGPTITSTSDDTPTDGTTLTISGLNFGASQGTGGVTVDGVSVTPNSWSDTAIVIPVAIGDHTYHHDLPIVVTANGGASSSAHNIQIQEASGVESFDLSGTLAAAQYRLTSSPDLAAGYQVEVSNIAGGTTAGFEGFSDGSYRVQPTVVSFRWRAHNGTEWGTYATEYPQSRQQLRALALSLAVPLSIDLHEGY